MTKRVFFSGTGLLAILLLAACEEATPAVSDAEACEGVSCSGHGACVAKEGVAFCDCEDGYRVAGTNFTECIASTVLCADADCGGHGICVVSRGVAFCDCDDGYHAAGEDLLTCAGDDVDPCDNVTCSGHGTCQSAGGVAFCDCEDGYEAGGPFYLECVARPDPCAGEDCSGYGVCVASSGVPFCDCDDGYHVTGAELLTCEPDVVEPCDGVTCSGHGTCVEDDGVASCDCEEGYLADGLTCVPESGWPATPEDYLPQGPSYVDTFVLPSMEPGDECCHDFGAISANGAGAVDNAYAAVANGFGSFGEFSINELIEASLQDGELVLLWDHRGAVAGGGVQVASLVGHWAPGTDYATAAAGNGQMTLELESFLPGSGEPRGVLAGEVAGDQLAAGPGTIHVPPSGLFAGLVGDAWLPLREARLSATLSGHDTSPLAVSHTSAELSGYFALADIREVVNTVVDQQCGCLGLAGDFLDADLSPSCVGDAADLCTAPEESVCVTLAGSYCAIFFLLITQAADLDIDADPSDYEGLSFGARLTAVPTEILGLFDPCVGLDLCAGTTESASCEGDVLTECVFNDDGCLVEQITDCAGIGSVCEEDGAAAACSCTDHPDCVGRMPGDGWCVGNQARMCVPDELGGCLYLETEDCLEPLVCDETLPGCNCPLVPECLGHEGTSFCVGNNLRTCELDGQGCVSAIDTICDPQVCSDLAEACVEAGSCVAPEPLSGDHVVVSGEDFFAVGVESLPFGYDDCLEPYMTDGPELAWEVVLSSGQTLVASETGSLDANIFVADAHCAESPPCVAVAHDDEGPVEITASLNGPYYVVVAANGTGQTRTAYRVQIDVDPVCGNDVTDGFDQCDDGNADGTDGCDSCVITFGYVCDTTVEPSLCAPLPVVELAVAGTASPAGQALASGEDAQYLLRLLGDGNLEVDLSSPSGDVDLVIYDSSNGLVIDAMNAGDEYLPGIWLPAGDYRLVVRAAQAVSGFSLDLSLSP